MNGGFVWGLDELVTVSEGSHTGVLIFVICMLAAVDTRCQPHITSPSCHPPSYTALTLLLTGCKKIQLLSASM